MKEQLTLGGLLVEIGDRTWVDTNCLKPISEVIRDNQTHQNQ